MLNTKNGVLDLNGTQMEYIRFGSGNRTLIMLPGLGDGLRTMKGTALPMAIMYRDFAREYTVYGFSRLSTLPQGYTTRDMARDQKVAMHLLGIEKADIFGVSMGGMIAQHLAADYPDKVDRLILAVTAARPNPMIQACIQEWIGQAQANDHAALIDSNLRLIYSQEYYRKNKAFIPMISAMTKPKSYDRFLVQANACLIHDCYDKLPSITAPTLVLGGEQDAVVGPEPSREIAARIPNAQLKMYKNWGHGLYDEEQGFYPFLLDYLTKTGI